MSYFIVLHGSLGAGKSTNAEKLAKTLDAEWISLDKVLKQNDLDNPQTDASIPAADFIKALDIIIPSVKKLLQDNKVVIFDGCFYHREVLDHLTQGLPFPHYIFTLKVPIDTCIERDKTRDRTIGKGVAEAVYECVSQHDFGILIDANTDLDTTHKTILSHLPPHQ